LTGTGAAAAGQRTQLSIYAPFSASGTPTVRVTNTVRGHCWTGSLAAAREDAWRCMSGNFIYDPCFSSASAQGIVLCPATGPWNSAAIEIRLTRSLPNQYGNKGKPSTSGLPWALVTMSGWKCRLATGATTVVDGRRANYGCTRTKDWLWGAPMRRSEPWRIYAASGTARKLSRTIAIRAAWF
jgi:hypothetical protein